MNKSGFLRRGILLFVFGWFYSRFVLNGSQFIWEPEVRRWLHWLLYAGIAWGVVTLLAERIGRGDNSKDEQTDGRE